MELCRNLRWKSFHGQASFTEDELVAMFSANHDQYSCLRTTQPWGEDEDLCAPERCTSDRACFVASDRVRALVG